MQAAYNALHGTVLLTSCIITCHEGVYTVRTLAVGMKLVILLHCHGTMRVRMTPKCLAT